MTKQTSQQPKRRRSTMRRHVLILVISVSIVFLAMSFHIVFNVINKMPVPYATMNLSLALPAAIAAVLGGAVWNKREELKNGNGK